jgi:uncharacterized protein (DUF927 family)
MTLTTKQFLEAFWGKGIGYICHARTGERRFKQQAVGDITAALSEVEIREYDADVWFSVATYFGPARKAADVATVKALYLDLDCGPNKDYDTKQDALAALVAFKNEYGLPRPCLIDSGNGIHVYWISAWGLDLNTWTGYAHRLKNACKVFGLRADAKVTTDAARVLRVVGTHNRKDALNPKPVEALYWSDNVYDLGDMVESFPEIPEPVAQHASLGIGPKPAHLGGAAEWQKGHGGMPPGDADMIANKCAAMAQVRDSKGRVPEPHWYAALQIINHCADSESIAHDWSSGHEQYDKNDVARRLQRLSDGEFGPTLCTTFEDVAPDACGSCPLRSKISSPIRLGRRLTPLVEDDMRSGSPRQMDSNVDADGDAVGIHPDVSRGSAQQATADIDAQLQVPRPVAESVPNHTAPQGWDVGEEGVWFRGYDGTDESKQALTIPMFLESVGRLGYTTAEAIVKWRTPMGTWRKAHMPLPHLYDKKSMGTWLTNNAITQAISIDMVMMYIRDSANMLAMEGDPELVAQRFGWNENGGFFLGHREIKADGIDEIRVADAVPSKMKRMLEPAGDKQAWIDATEVYDNPRYWAQAFALLASMASPIIKLADWQGAVLSLAGDSGTGKTTSSQFGLSVYGQPNGLTISPQATSNALGGMFNFANNLPLAIDDMSGKHTNKLPDLIYSAANGYAKEAMTQTRQLREAGTWCFCLTITTNNPVMDLPLEKLGEAQRRRTLELYFTEKMERQDAKRLHDVMRDNYGVVADDLVSAYCRNKEKIKDMAHEAAEHYQNLGTIDDANRFGVWLLAAAQVAGSIATQLGLIKFDYEPVIAKVAKQLQTSSNEIQLPEVIADECIAEFIAHNNGKFSKHNGEGYTNKTSMDIREVVGRTQTNHNVRYIPTATLNAWFVERGVPLSALKAWRALNEPSGYKNNQMIVPQSKQQRCVVIPYDPDIEMPTKQENEPADKPLF